MGRPVTSKHIFNNRTFPQSELPEGAQISPLQVEEPLIDNETVNSDYLGDVTNPITPGSKEIGIMRTYTHHEFDMAMSDISETPPVLNWKRQNAEGFGALDDALSVLASYLPPENMQKFFPGFDANDTERSYLPHTRVSVVGLQADEFELWHHEFGAQGRPQSANAFFVQMSAEQDVGMLGTHNINVDGLSLIVVKVDDPGRDSILELHALPKVASTLDPVEYCARQFRARTIHEFLHAMGVGENFDHHSDRFNDMVVEWLTLYIWRTRHPNENITFDYPERVVAFDTVIHHLYSKGLTEQQLLQAFVAENWDEYGKIVELMRQTYGDGAVNLFFNMPVNDDEYLAFAKQITKPPTAEEFE